MSNGFLRPGGILVGSSWLDTGRQERVASRQHLAAQDGLNQGHQMPRATTFCGFILIAVIAGCGETPEVYYPTYSEAISDDAVGRGWIPAWLPKSAIDIHEIHNIDTNRSMLAFRWDGADNMEFRSECEEIEPGLAEEPAFHVPWWPRDVADNSQQPYSFYACEGGRAFLAISRERRKARYWRP